MTLSLVLCLVLLVVEIKVILVKILSFSEYCYISICVIYDNCILFCEYIV